MKVTPSKALEKIKQKPLVLKENLPAEAAGAMDKVRSQKDPLPDVPTSDRTDLIPYVPLPLRSQIYEETRFYGKLRDLKYKLNDQGEVKVIFCVKTDTLGLLWFNLAMQPGKLLSVQCLTEHNGAAELFKNSIPRLQEELAAAGFPAVVVTCRLQPGIRGIADIDADFAAAPFHSLIDMQV